MAPVETYAKKSPVLIMPYKSRNVKVFLIIGVLMCDL